MLSTASAFHEQRACRFYRVLKQESWNATCSGARMNRPALRPEELRNPREVWNARDYGLAGDGQTNDQPALQELVDELGRACKADGLPRVVYCPPGAYRIAGRTTAWRS